MNENEIFGSSSMFIGETTNGIAEPAFFDVHTPIFNNKPPTTVITGSPGSGKTFFGLLLTTINCMLGKTVVVLDPKGDFLSLINLKNEIGNFNIWDLTNNKKNGLLDPFYMAEDDGDKLDLVVSVIDIFSGGLSDVQMTVLAPIVKDVLKEPVPSLQGVIDGLRRSNKEVARALGVKLNLLKEMPYAKLCFSPGNKKKKIANINSGLTIVTMGGMNIPSNEDEAKSNSGRLVTGILYLLTDFIRRIMKNDNTKSPKLVLIDEAWSILTSPQGAGTIKSLSLLGRSRNLALVLITQNNKHLKNLDLENTVSSRFAFHADPKESKTIIHDMQLPENEGFEDQITNLENGECLMQDFLGRYATIKITTWRDDWAKAFDTNPLKKLINQK